MLKFEAVNDEKRKAPEDILIRAGIDEDGDFGVWIGNELLFRIYSDGFVKEFIGPIWPLPSGLKRSR